MTGAATGPITTAELAALHALGHGWLREGDPPNVIVEVYRAGFAAGATPTAARVFRTGDPEPGAEVAAVMDCDGDTWVRTGAWWRRSGGDQDSWLGILDYGPLVSCSPLDYDSAVKADYDERFAVAKSAGGDAR